MLHVEVVVVGDVLPNRAEFVLVDNSLTVNDEVADLPALKESSAFYAGFLITTTRTLVNVHLFVFLKAFVGVSAILNELVEIL